MYNYRLEEKNDIYNFITENYADIKSELEERDSFYESLYDQLFVEDSVTGNASGSYTFNRYQARKYVLDNDDLLREAYEAFCCMDSLGDDFIEENYEKMDVTIRCYLLSECLNDVLDDLENELE